MSERMSRAMTVGELLRRGMAGRACTPEEREARQRQHDAEKALAHVAAEKRMAEMFPTYLARCGVPERTCREAGRDYLRDTKALLEAQAWMGGQDAHLLLSGTTGVGKSLAAAWALRLSRRVAAWGLFDELEWDDHGALWMPFGRLCRLSQYAAPDLETVRRAQRVRVLVLDDVGTGDAESLKPYEKQRLEELADERDAEGRRTVWTTNLGVHGGDDSSFARYVGARVFSRLVRSVHAVDCSGMDLRRQS